MNKIPIWWIKQYIAGFMYRLGPQVTQEEFENDRTVVAVIEDMLLAWAEEEMENEEYD